MTDSMLSRIHQTLLLQIARQSIQHGAKNGLPLPVDPQTFADQLTTEAASFVTLEKFGQLRGCIGSVEGYRPLVEDVAENAWNAAFRDPRFSAVTLSEIETISIEISILTPPSPLDVKTEKDLLDIVQPGLDGLILEDKWNRGLFLPAVWEKIPDKQDFLNHLKQKAGFPADYWSNSIKILRFRSFAFKDDD